MSRKPVVVEVTVVEVGQARLVALETAVHVRACDEDGRW
jgi:hypothetical protein